MIGQILNFGLPSPIDVQIVGFNVDGNRAFANELLQKLRSVPGAVDLHIQQSADYPQFNVDVDRGKAQLVGLTEQAIARQLARLALRQLSDLAFVPGSTREERNSIPGRHSNSSGNSVWRISTILAIRL